VSHGIELGGLSRDERLQPLEDVRANSKSPDPEKICGVKAIRVLLHLESEDRAAQRRHVAVVVHPGRVIAHDLATVLP